MPEYLFIYDHTILQGKEDSNYDPTDAIVYFYPQATAIEYQHSLCSHTMGFCQILSNLFQSSPKLFNLDSGAKLACIHEPELGLVHKTNSRVLTFAVYSDDNDSIHLHDKCRFLYESFIFYTKKCLSCIFLKGKTKSNYVNNIVSRLMGLINHRDKLSSIFDASLYNNHGNRSCRHIEPSVYQIVINMIDSIHRESQELNVSILGGCLFYKKCLILNQFSTNVASLFSLMIDCLNNDANKTGKETFSSLKRIQVDVEDLQARDGVFLFQICVTRDRYCEMLDFSRNACRSSNRGCCDSKYFHYLHVYLEHHSNMTIVLLIDEPDLENINKDLLKIFSKLCFNTLGEIEASIATTRSVADDKTDTKATVGASNIWNINYDEHDRSVSATNICNGGNIAADWEEWLLKRASILHYNLENEKSVKEIHVQISKESLSAVRTEGQQIFTIKSSNT